jgi:hypothetical protein
LVFPGANNSHVPAATYFPQKPKRTFTGNAAGHHKVARLWLPALPQSKGRAMPACVFCKTLAGKAAKVGTGTDFAQSGFHCTFQP